MPIFAITNKHKEILFLLEAEDLEDARKVLFSRCNTVEKFQRLFFEYCNGDLESELYRVCTITGPHYFL